MPTPPPAIDTPPLAPDPSNRGTFNLLAYNWSMSLAPLSGQFAAAAANVYANAQEAVAAAQTAILAPGTHATSATSLTIGTGSKVLSIQTGKQFSVGQFVIVASTGSPQNYLFGQITAHDSVAGSLTVNAVSVGGSGTFASWTVGLTSPWNAASQISFSPAGGLSGTNVQAVIAELDAEKMPKTGGIFTGIFGYGAGVGGWVEQPSSKYDGVSLNKLCGKIIMAAGDMAAGAMRSFVCYNSHVTAADVVLSTLQAESLGSTDYIVTAHVKTGEITFSVQNRSSSTLNNKVQINFMILRGAAF